MQVFNTTETIIQYREALSNGRVDQKTEAFATAAIALANQAFSAASNHSRSSLNSAFPNCLTLKCPDLLSIPENREQKAIDQIKDYFEKISRLFGEFYKPSQELLRLNINDPRDKWIYFSAEADHNNGLNPEIVSESLNQLNNKFDLKFKEFNDFNQICEEIKEAPKAGTLIGVVIHGHGWPYGMILSKPDPKDPAKDRWLDEALLKAYPSCFSGLEPYGKIFLSSCCTGAPGIVKDQDCFAGSFNGFPVNRKNYKPFAQVFADFSNRQVVAAQGVSFPARIKIKSLDPFMVSHPTGIKIVSHNPVAIDTSTLNESKNLYKIFYPKRVHCTDLEKDKLNAKELDALEVIKNDHLSRGLLVDPVTFTETQNSLRVCKDDPKDKFLHLVAKEDLAGALNPHNYPEFLGYLADKFDLKYAIIDSPKDVCSQVNEAIKTGKVAAVLIHAYGNPNDGLLLSNNGKDGRIAKATDISDCLSALPKSARIILAGGESGAPRQNDPLNNLAQEIATLIKRTVLAPIGLMNPRKLQVSSVTPLMINHPNPQTNSGNFFRIFNPLSDNGKLVQADLHLREKEALDVIKSHLVAKHFRSEDVGFTEMEEFLQFSEADLRDKFLYVSANWDFNNSFSPWNDKKELGEKAEKYDLAYRVVQSKEQICNLIQEATKVGKLAGVHLIAHGKPFKPDYLKHPFDRYEWNDLDIYSCDSLGNCALAPSKDVLLSRSNDVNFQSRDGFNVLTAIVPGFPNGDIFGWGKPEKWNVMSNEDDFSNCIFNNQSYDSIKYTKSVLPGKTRLAFEMEKNEELKRAYDAASFFIHQSLYDSIKSLR